MEKGKKVPASVDEYIGAFPEEVRDKLSQLRKLIRETAPEAQERISYSMPAFFQNGIVVWFAGHTKHIGFYPGASGIAAFQDKLSRYKGAKGSVQFPLAEPLPLELIKEIVLYRLKENLAKKK